MPMAGCELSGSNLNPSNQMLIFLHEKKIKINPSQNFFNDNIGYDPALFEHAPSLAVSL